ncbi:MAG: CoA pyrophosphatase [Chloroflexota bacterium]
MVLTEARIAHMLHAGFGGADASSDGYAEIDVTEHTELKCAAVLIPLVQEGDAWHILYTRRTQRVESHKGQVSFPGGGCDDGETSPEQTALREAREEIGIDPAAVRILGRLTNMITVTSFRVTPVVGVINWPTVFRLNEHEVERIFTVPLTWLADSANRWELPFPGRNRSVVVYHPYDGEVMWGATARMTVDFLNTIGL